ncbi:unknown [Prevotella sp. CAG:1058]|nr:unknown [Prevotella sp. CAG:1058]
MITNVLAFRHKQKTSKKIYNEKAFSVCHHCLGNDGFQYHVCQRRLCIHVIPRTRKRGFALHLQL